MHETLGKGAGDGKGGLWPPFVHGAASAAEFAETHAQGAYIAP